MIDTTTLDVDDAACLAGGIGRAINTADVALLESGQVRAQRDGRLTVAEPTARHQVGAAELEAAGTRASRPLRKIRSHARKDKRLGRQVERLTQERFLSTRVAKRQGLADRRVAECVLAIGAHARAWTLALLACVAVAALAACGADAERSEATGEVTASGDVGALDVRVGDCLSEVPGGSVFATEVETVSAVPCEQEHAGEVYDSFELADAEFPGDEQTFVLAQEGCAERFGAFVGLSYDLARLEIAVLTPSSETWDIGDHKVVCIVSDPGGPLTDSPRGLGRAAAPAVGSCWEALGTEVDCAVAHDAEIYALVDLPDDVWPGQKTLSADAERACQDQFGEYVGLAYDRSALDFASVTPVEASWAAGDRLVGCVVLDPAAPLTGSVRGSGR